MATASVRIGPSLLAASALVLAVVFPVAARDWPEPVQVIDPLLTTAPGLVTASGLAQFEYNYQAFRSSFDDLFQLNGITAFSVAGLDDGSAVVRGAGVALQYASYLMNGNVQAGDTAGSRLQWVMNAVQFEYGIYFAARVLGVDVLADYARTSQHPFRDRYSQVASDLLQIGLAKRLDMPWSVAAVAALRLTYSDLFDFWQSPLPKPRSRYLVTPALWLSRPIGSFPLGVLRVQASAEAEGSLDWAFLRGGGQGAKASGRAGVRLASGALSLVAYLDGYASDNSEIRTDRATPVGLSGWGVRLESGAAVSTAR